MVMDAPIHRKPYPEARGIGRLYADALTLGQLPDQRRHGALAGGRKLPERPHCGLDSVAFNIGCCVH
ncbi:MAG: hypothetical protein WBC61_07005 [Dehalococcoidia bacterium]